MDQDGVPRNCPRNLQRNPPNGPEKTWGSNSSIATYWTGSVGKVPIQSLMDTGEFPDAQGGSNKKNSPWKLLFQLFHLKIDGWKMINFLLTWSLFRGRGVKFRNGQQVDKSSIGSKHQTLVEPVDHESQLLQAVTFWFSKWRSRLEEPGSWMLRSRPQSIADVFYISQLRTILTSGDKYLRHVSNEQILVELSYIKDYTILF